ncbi:Glycosyltransferase involved in cell wall bisynthesis [Paenibacillus sp. UNCCL117]|uniref:glycosyltransferase family 4 protein n=1 Tax=unclassified Paenibacillus TaxID=185978 RepID=UPI0008836B9F|nr:MULTISPECIES: glycosyltransferase family 4 protein [unclassified Paenibacillus]SDC03004.1 Glycosyltransferase involved in cell wall bisynthesis [Paenibacillus sp. cl123]SFW36974.1 Glycosyltransferase involved in cell wall bisynthesis [Paenibacillus sp. UNCCL117]
MRIAHYCYGYFREGGIQTYVRTISRAQAEQGHEMYLFDYLTPEMPRKPYEEPYGTYHGFTSPRELADLCERLSIDVLHLHDYCPVSLRDVQAEGTRVIRTIHNHGLHCPSGSKFFKNGEKVCERGFSYMGCLWGHMVNHCGSRRPNKILENFQSLFTEKRVMADIPIIAVSDYLRNQVIEAGFAPEDVKTLHLPMQSRNAAAPQPLPDGPPRFVFLGRITPLKGLEWLIRAIALTDEPVCLDVAGEGYEVPRLKALSESLGLADRVVFHGWLKSEDSMRLIQGSRAVIAPSLWPEPAGFTPFEAMAQNRAVIASRIGGLQESVRHGVNGLLVDVGDVKAMADAIRTLAEDTALAEAMGEAGYRLVKTRHDLGQHVARLTELYQEHAARKAGRRVSHGQGA